MEPILILKYLQWEQLWKFHPSYKVKEEIQKFEWKE